jgi:glycosyltransferase involved in cell wall biosynthesis
MMPSVTIIIPTYNNETTIKRCIDSVLNQTLEDIEIIIINDGSTDKTQEVLDSLPVKDKRIQIIKKDHAGQGIARNLGIMHSSGTYIGFVDADDTICEVMYEKMFNKAIENNADIVQCNIVNIFPDETHTIQLPYLDRLVHVNDKRKYFDEYLFRPKHSFECCNKLIKRSFLFDNNISFESNSKVFSEDLLFNLDMAAKLNTIVFMGNPYYNYYQYGNSHSMINSIEKIEKLCVLFDIFYNKEKKLRFECAKIAILIIMINLSKVLGDNREINKAKEILHRHDIKKISLSLLFKNEKN